MYLCICVRIRQLDSHLYRLSVHNSFGLIGGRPDKNWRFAEVPSARVRSLV